MKNLDQYVLRSISGYLERKSPSLLFLFLIMILSLDKLHATNYVSNATGNWNTSTIWTPNGVPGSADNVTIKGGTTVTVNGFNKCNNLNIGETTSGNTGITIAAGDSLTINGALSINPNSINKTYTLNANTGTLIIGGTFPTWCSTTGTNTIQVNTGTIAFTPAVTISSASQNITFNGAGSIYFNGSLTDKANKLVTAAGANVYFGASYTVNTTAAVWNATANAIFTGTATVTPGAAITFGNVQLNAGSAVTLAGNITVAGNWTNNGGRLLGGSNTVYLTGNGKTISGTSATLFPTLQVGTGAAATAYTMNNADSCAALVFYGGAQANTFTLAATLTVTGSVTLNQNTGPQTNSLVVNASTCNINGNLDFVGIAPGANQISKVSVTTGALTVTGAVNFAANTTAANQVITLTSTGSITFGSSLSMAYGTLSTTSTGALNFNGASPSFTLGGAGTPVFTTTNGGAINFAHGFTNTTAAYTFAATSNTIFTGNGTLTANANITFGNLQMNGSDTLASTGKTVDIAGNYILSSGAAFDALQNFELAGTWTNNGGTMSGTNDTIQLIGNAKTIGGTSATTFQAVQLGNSASAAVSYTMNNSNSCTALIFYSNGVANTFTVTASDTLTVNGNVTINQGTAAITNNLADNGIVIINGNLNLPGTVSTLNFISKVTVGNGATLNVSGALNYGSNTAATNNIISVGTGTVTFSSAVNLSSGTIQYTAAGTINFNGPSPSFTFGGANAPVFTTFAACNINFQHGFTNNTAVVFNATSLTTFTGAGSINPLAAITFGKLTISGSDTLLNGGANVIVAGNYILSSGALFYAEQNFEVDANWTNNGGTLSGTTYTAFFNGAAQTISGQPTTFQTLEAGNSTSAVTVAVTMSCTNTCQSFIMQGSTLSRTFTISAGDTLNVTGTVTIDQPTVANKTNNLAVGAGVCIVSGGLTFSGATNTATFVGEVTVSTGSFSVAGAVTWMGVTTPASQQVQLTGTGTITFGTSVTMGAGSGELLISSAGTVNFNGTSAPSFSFGGVAASFTTTNGCTLNFKKGFSNTANAITLAGSSNAVFTGTGTITPTAAITFGNLQINSGAAVTLAGNISVKGNWTDNGTLTPATYAVTFNAASPAVQTITDASGETFYGLTGSVAGSTVQLDGNVTVTGTLNMTGSYFNLNGNTLTLGNGAGAALNYTAGQAYGGTFKRYIPAATAITATSGNYYGLFPIGTSSNYNPVKLTSTVNATTGGYILSVFNSGSVAIPVTYTDNESSVIQAISAMNSTLTTSGLAGGTYNISCTYNGFTNAGVITDLKLETYTGNAMGSYGTSAATTGTVPNPTVYRTGLTAAQLANVWVVGTKNLTNTPLYYFYYSRIASGNWDGLTTWSYSPGGSGAACGCVPAANANVTISPGQTVTIDLSVSPSYITVSNGATLNDNSLITLNCNQTVTVLGTGKVVNSGTWNLTGPVNFSTSSVYTATGNVTMSGLVSMPAGSTYTQSSGTLTLSNNTALNGTITLGPTGSLAIGGAGIALSGAGSVLTTGGGTVTITGGPAIAAGSSLTFGSAADTLPVTISGAQNVTNSGTLIINGSLLGTVAGSTFTNQNGGTLEVTGNLLPTGTLSAETAYNTVILNGSGNQTFNPSTLGFSELTIANGGTKTLSGNSTVATTLTIQDSATLDESTYTLTGTANLVMTGSGQLKLQRSSSGSYPEFTGTLTLGSSSSITVNQTAGTDILPPVAYGNLSFTGSSSYDLSGVTTIAGNFTLGNAASVINNAPLKVTGAFTYNSSASSTLANTLSVGSFTQSAGTFNDGGYAITVKGAGWTNNGGTFNATGSVSFKGSATQSIGGTAATTFDSLTINNIKGLVLNQPVSISGFMNLSSGIITSSATAPLTMLAGTTFTGSSNTCYIAGPMVKVGKDDFVFPVGDDNVVGLAAISGLSNPATQVTAQYFHHGYADQTDISPSLTGIGKDEYWTIERTVTSDSMQIELFWQNAAASGIMDCDYITVAHYTGGQWINEQGSATNGSDCLGQGSGSVQTNGYVTSFSPFTFGGSGGLALPVQLLSFNAVAQNKTVLTTWVTQMQINNAYFTVERSPDAVNFEAVGTVNGAGNSTELMDYEFTDEAPLNGQSYYRLRQTDFNGHSTLSQVVPVNFISNGAMTVYPNPAAGQVYVRIANPQSEILVDVEDMTGRKVFSQTYNTLAGASSQVIALPSSQDLPAGVYLVTAYTGGNEYKEKLVVN